MILQVDELQQVSVAMGSFGFDSYVSNWEGKATVYFLRHSARGSYHLVVLGFKIPCFG